MILQQNGPETANAHVCTPGPLFITSPLLRLGLDEQREVWRHHHHPW